MPEGSPTSSEPGDSHPLFSVIVLNYNGAQWISKCIHSVLAQTLWPDTELIVADNSSTDQSDRTAAELLANKPRCQFLQNGANLGFAEGNNRATALARGKYLLFLNNDAWLEPDCLAALASALESTGATAACPLILNYDDHTFQSIGALGFDFFGLPTERLPVSDHRPVLMPEGCAYLVRRDAFAELGGFDPEFFMYAEEYDLSWRLWVSGHLALTVPEARVHHRGAANVNPAGGETVVEFRTSDTKRYYANRNALLVLLKNAQHILLLACILQLLLLALEALAALLLVRRASFVRKSYWEALRDCWKLRHHILRERRRINAIRKRSDFDMLNFLSWHLNRWDEIKRVRQFGLPKVAPK